MGDPRKQRRRYERPQHPWRSDRITEENELCKKYGLKNKKEIWKAKSRTGRFREQARKLLGSSGEEREKESKELLDKLNRLGILESPSIEDVLGLNVENLLERRLETRVYRGNLANTIKQARQLIVHGHIIVGDNVVSIPGYITPKDEEDKIKLNEKIKVVKLDEGKQGEKVPEKEKA
ncbi:MAG: 30S ribosomal protein S4 [Candidatus Altiarchaeota archaeon]|nr:30S ribosomal protein S4 [Candidatus Altiarchaeota archaeon]